MLAALGHLLILEAVDGLADVVTAIATRHEAHGGAARQSLRCLGVLLSRRCLKGGCLATWSALVRLGCDVDWRASGTAVL